MSDQYIILPECFDVEQAVKLIKAGENTSLNIIFVVDSKQKVIGTVSFGMLLKSSASTSISSLVDNTFKTMKSTETIDQALQDVAWQYVSYLPVIDKNKALVGLISLSDLVRAKKELRPVHFNASNLNPIQAAYQTYVDLVANFATSFQTLNVGDKNKSEYYE